MVVPLLILALLSFVGGWVGVPHSLHGSDRFGTFLSPVFNRGFGNTAAMSAAAAAESKPESEDSSTELIFSWHLGRDWPRSGFVLAWYLYYKRPELPRTNGQGCRRSLHAGAEQVQDRRTLRSGHHSAAHLAVDQCLLEGHRSRSDRSARSMAAPPERRKPRTRCARCSRATSAPTPDGWPWARLR